MSRISLVLITGDATFGALFRQAVAARDDLDCRTVVSPGNALAAVRETSPDHVLLDTDGQAPAYLLGLCRKLALVRPARIVVTGATMAAVTSDMLGELGVRCLAKPSTSAGLDLVDASVSQSFLDALLDIFAPGVG